MNEGREARGARVRADAFVFRRPATHTTHLPPSLRGRRLPTYPRFRARRKARIAELEATAAAHAAALATRAALEAEVTRLRALVAAARAGQPLPAADEADFGDGVGGLLTPVADPPASGDARGGDPSSGSGGATHPPPSASDDWARLLPRLVPADWDGTPSPVRRQLEAAAVARSVADAGAPRAQAPPPVPPAAVSIRLPHAPGGGRGARPAVTAEDMMRWPWRTHMAVLRAAAGECARLLPAVAAGDDRAAAAAAAAGAHVRALLTVLGATDPRRAALLALTDLRSLGLPCDGDGRASARAAAAALAATITPQQRAAAAAAGQAHAAAVAAARARRAALVPLACGGGGELRALEAQGLLRANLDEEVAAAALLTHALLATILTPGQVAAAVGAAYPSGLDAAAVVAALTGAGCGPSDGGFVSPSLLEPVDEPFAALLA